MRWITAARVALSLVLTLPLTARAQSASAGPSVTVPRLIQITGVYQPVDGQAPAAIEVVTLSIYAEPEGGLPVWQEQQSVAIDKTGRFTLLLGASYPEGIPAEVFGTGQAQWMSLLFERAREVEQPRVRIASVPYALRASDAETLGGLPASAYALAASGASPTGATGASAPVTATASEPVPGTSDLVLAGTTNFLAKYVNSADVGNSAVYEAPTALVPTGAVGIGTTAPADVLHLRFNNTGGQITGLAVQNLGNTGAPYSGMLFYDHNGVLGQFQGFNNLTHEYRINNIARNGSSVLDGSINFMIGSSSKFFVGSNGNIGIGTTAPSSNLDVSNAISATPFGTITATTYVGGAVGSLFRGQKARGTAAAPTAVQFGDTLAMFAGRGYGATAFGAQTGGMAVRANENWTDSAQGTTLHFFTTPNGTAGSVTRMALDPSGNLGLGVSSPSAALEIVRQEGTPLEVHLTRYAGSSSSGEPNLLLRTARGTVIAPSAIQAGDELGGYAMTGYGATGFGEFGAGMAALAAENWTDTAQGTTLLFGTTPIGSNEAQITMLTLPNGNTGIGLPTGSGVPVITDRLEVFGDVRVGTTGTNGCLKNFAGTGIAGTCSSDRRLKRDITPFSPVLNQLAALQPVHYHWRRAEFPGRHFGDSLAYGLIAQDVEEVLPELVVTDGEGFKAVDYSKLPLLTIQAVKELKADNDTLEQRVSQLELESENDALKQRVADLERTVAQLLAAVSLR